MNEVVIPEKELDKVLDKITEAVCQGIVASKETESNFWGEAKSHHLKTDLRLKNIEDTLIELRDYMKIQNGRTRTLEDESSFNKGMVKVIGIVVAVLISIMGYFAITVIDIGNKVSTHSALLEKK